jgi:hypothetical protein
MMDRLPASATELNTATRSPKRAVWVVVLLLLTAGSAYFVYQCNGNQKTITPLESASILPASDPKIDKLRLFATWPDQKPELVILVTGQMYGYLQKCGCSNPQKGGLERRYNLIDWLRNAKGWEVLPVDLGDIAGPEKGKLHKQSLLKYQVAMESLQAMGYRGIGVGREEFRFPLLDALATFSLQDAKATPKVLNANILKREESFPSPDGEGSMLNSFDVFEGKSVKVGLTSVIGKALIPEVVKIDGKIEFAPDSSAVLKNSLAEIQAKLKGPADLNLLLYQGELEDTDAVAKLLPQFQVIVCRSKESEPPAVPDAAGNTVVLRVGHKGQNVGVLGVFREKGKLVFHYEKIAIGEEFETPENREANHPILKKYDWYAKEVRDRKFLPQFPKAPHQMEAAFPDEKISFVGTQACVVCHQKENQVWAESKHAKGYAALEKIARKPEMRNFDGECIVCHTVGFQYLTGFDGTEKTMHLKNIGCENCHGPGSLHTSKPLEKKYHRYLSPWKTDAKEVLPGADTMKKLLEAKTPEERAKLITPAQEKLLIRIDDICQKCHDTDNDPHFRFEKYWPQIVHTGLKK